MNFCPLSANCGHLRVLGIAAAIAFAAGLGSAVLPVSAERAQVAAPAKPDDKPSAKAPPKSDPYPLSTCIVSGEKLGGMGAPVIKEYDGREVRFCCNGCIAKFEMDKASLLKKIDQQIIAQQLPHYPLKTCVVMSEDELVNEGDGKAVDMVYGNRLVRFCCAGCIKKFKADPAAYLAKIDAAVIAEQKPQYPLEIDVVTGEKLGPNAIDHVYGVMLVRFANADSMAKFNADPLPSVTKIHEAWMAKHPHADAEKDAPKPSGPHG